jgi:VCBS repeat-containing protein
MPTTSSVKPTGDLYIDGVLSGTQWAVNSLTYSFPAYSSFYGAGYGSGEPSNNFKAFTTIQQDAVNDVLANYSAVSNLTFTEVTETSTQHGDLRYAESDSPGTAWAYYPSTSAAGGDAWFNNSRHYYDSPNQGNYGYLSMLHETGHALGLKHPQDIKGAFGTEPLDHDSLEYTVMSYKSYIGGSTTSGYTNEANSYPQTLMMLDIAAIQDMYGANYNTQAGDTVYNWSPNTGELFINGVGQSAPSGNKIFMTLWDGGGHDTYDFSNYSTSLNVDLSPGGWTTASSTQLAYLGNGHYAAGNIANALLYQGNTASLIENAIGGTGNDILIGNVADNHLTGGAGNDYLDGGDGTDTTIYSGLLSNYTITHNADASWTVVARSGTDGTDTLLNIEDLQFADTLLDLATYALPAVVANSEPMITSAAQLVSLTEWADKSASETANTAHTASGALAYSDPDVSDTHSGTFTPQGTGYLGTFSLTTGSIDTTDSIGWSFSVLDSALDYLKAGQSLIQNYNVTVDDGHGGLASSTVTISLIGADDVSSKGGGGGKKGGGADVAGGNSPADAYAGILSNSDKNGTSGDQAAGPATAYTNDTSLINILGVADLLDHPMVHG